MFKKVLIANRGEIAVRIIRACRELGVRSIVAHSEADRDALPVQMADESFCIGPAPTAKSYLNPPNIITAALVTGADAIHPGYGFLSENIYFAEICEKCHVAFIGPRPDVIATMGDKAVARERMAAAGLPVLPGTNRALRSLEEAQDVALDIGYPVILKARRGRAGKHLPHGAGRGAGRLRQQPALHGKVPGALPPRRGTGDGRCPRQRDPPGRT